MGSITSQVGGTNNTPPVDPPHLQYSYTDLGTLGGTNSYATGINNLGQVVGSSQLLTSGKDQLTHATLWDHGVTTDLGAQQGLGSSYSYASAINDSGQVVGSSSGFVNNAASHAALWSNGTITDLAPSTSFRYSVAKAINIGGVTVGQDADGVATMWTTTGSTSLDGPLSYASGVNNHGIVAGNDATGHAATWNGTNVTQLEDWPEQLGQSVASGINDSGAVVGLSKTFMHGTIPTVWINGQPSALPLLHGEFSQPFAINNQGQIVGQAADSYRFSRATLWDGSQVLDLNTLTLDRPVAWIMTSATAVNDSGMIVGTATDAMGDSHAFLLTPVPEPSTVAMWLLGLAALNACMRRRRFR
jgi:probable HAF family extracellular repeat protein